MFAGISDAENRYWIPLSEQAIKVIYKLSNHPDTVCQEIIRLVIQEFQVHSRAAPTSAPTVDNASTDKPDDTPADQTDDTPTDKPIEDDTPTAENTSADMATPDNTPTEKGAESSKTHFKCVAYIVN